MNYRYAEDGRHKGASFLLAQPHHSRLLIIPQKSPATTEGPRKVKTQGRYLGVDFTPAFSAKREEV
ncbi:MAG: hypothetical protein KDB03_19710 [Planctomycetales bacterium]|nr:hypothetical protein [Planctomycetales bacterium]